MQQPGLRLKDPSGCWSDVDLDEGRARMEVGTPVREQLLSPR